MQTMDDAITEIYNKGQVDPQTAVIYAHDADAMRRRVRMY
jgi:Tfp pilus assembly ATPase PilU